MSDAEPGGLRGAIVEEELRLTLVELCRACDAREEEVTAWVLEGVLDPEGDEPRGWRFGGPSLRRARRAARLSRDLGIDAAAVALVLDLMDEIDRLKARR
ncbi:Chaperone modulatory protein CbpM [Burkholderiales bacterium]|nr:Chaperone modulatory protein CbpM [Burkholderiales bacterium]